MGTSCFIIETQKFLPHLFLIVIFFLFEIKFKRLELKNLNNREKGFETENKCDFSEI